MQRQLPRETWGDQLHRAYRLARRRHGRGFSYREVARRISTVYPTNDAAIIRLESFEQLPKEQHHRALAALCIAVYGFYPSVLGLHEKTVDPRVLELIDLVAD